VLASARRPASVCVEASARRPASVSVEASACSTTVCTLASARSAAPPSMGAVERFAVERFAVERFAVERVSGDCAELFPERAAGLGFFFGGGLSASLLAFVLCFFVIAFRTLPATAFPHALVRLACFRVFVVADFAVVFFAGFGLPFGP